MKQTVAIIITSVALRCQLEPGLRSTRGSVTHPVVEQFWHAERLFNDGESREDTATPVTRGSWGREHTERNGSIVWRAATVGPARWPFDRMVISCLPLSLAWTPALLLPSRLSRKHPVVPQTGHRVSHVTGFSARARIHCTSSISTWFCWINTNKETTDRRPQYVSFHLPKIPISRTKTRSQTHVHGVPWLFREPRIINVAPTSPPHQPLPRSMDGVKGSAFRSFYPSLQHLRWGRCLRFHETQAPAEREGFPLFVMAAGFVDPFHSGDQLRAI